MRTYIVTVTYGDRFHYIQSLIESAFIEGVDKIIIVNNCSDDNSTKLLNALNNPKIKLITLSSNTGSANGFKQGMIEAQKDPSCDFIWLVDDDNMPSANSLTNLKKQWEKEDLNDLTKICLLSYRQDRKKFKEAIQFNNPSLMLGFKNSFRGFHVINPIYSFIKKIRTLNFKKNLEKTTGIVSVAPYSGMFFHKSLLTKIGMPDSKYFVYADDYDFSYRISENGGHIRLILDSKIIDNEKSWHLSFTKKWNSSLFACDESKRVYYGLRNCVYFESQYRVDKKIVYITNMMIYLFLLKLFSILQNNPDRYRLILEATKDGLNQKLGIKEDFI